MKSNQKVTWLERVSYGGFFFGQNMYYATLSSFFMIFLTNKAGLTAVSVGTLLFISRFWDAINDPIIGFLIDKAKLKKGKFIPWIRVSVFLLPIGFFLLFQVPFADALLQTVYSYFAYFLFDIIYTMSDVPIFAISTVVSEDINERTKYLSFGRFTAIFGALLPAFVLPGAIATGEWTLPVIIVTVLGFVLMLPMVFFAKERVQHKTNEDTPLKEMLGNVLKNKYLFVYMLSFFVLRALLVSSIAGNYFYTFVMNDTSLISKTTLIGLLPALVFAGIMPWLVKHFGKRNIYIFAHVISLVAGIAFYFVGFKNPTMILLFAPITSLALVASSIMNGLFVGDCIEYGEYKTGERNEGIAYAFQTFTNKAATAMVAMIGGILLAASGYIANAAISEEVARGLFNMMAVFPLIGIIGSLIIFVVFYRLSEAKVNEYITINRKSEE